MVERGNHKSAPSKENTLQELVIDNVWTGFQVPVPVETVKKIKGGVVEPYGIAEQFSINERGEIIEKNRITHDQSFEFLEGNSINSQLIRDNLPLLRYRGCLAQVIYYAHTLRLMYLEKIIVVVKVDLKLVYRRVELCGLLAVIVMIIVGLFTLISLRLPFSRAYCLYW